MMNRPVGFSSRVNPGLDNFKDKEVVFSHQLHVNDLTFQAGITFSDEWGFDELGGQGSESKFLELIHAATGSIPTSHHGLCQFHGGNVNRKHPVSCMVFGLAQSC